MDKLKNLDGEKKYIFSVFVSVLFLYVLRMCTIKDVNISLDEIGTFATAATLGGRDWFGVFPWTRYYGYGFFWIYAPVFWVTDNPYIIYIVIYFGNSILVALTSVLIYKCAIKELGFKNNISTMLVAILPSAGYYMVNCNYLTNDTIVYFGFWLVIYYLLRLFNSVRKNDKKRYSMILSFVICYLLTVHERTIIVIAVVVPLLVLWKLLIKESIVDWKVFCSSLAIFYVLARISKQYAIEMFWSEIKADNLANTSAIHVNPFWFLGDIKAFKVIIDVFISNIIKLGNATYGTIYIVLALVIVLFIDLIRKQWSLQHIKSANKQDKKLIFITVVSLIVTFGTIVGLAIQWGKGIYATPNRLELGKKVRAYTYLRYYVGYIGPALFAGYKVGLNKRWRNKIIVVAELIMFICLGYFLLEIDSYLREQAYVIDFVCVHNNLTINRGISIVLMSICIALLGCFYIKQSRKIYIIITAIVILLMFKPLELSLPRLESDLFGSTYECICKLEEKNVEVENIYFVSFSSSGGYQFFLNKYPLSKWSGQQDGIVVGDEGIIELLQSVSHTKYVKLDDNEYIFFWNDELIDVFSDNNYAVQGLMNE